MNSPSLHLDKLIKELSKLPGIGPKSASRLAFHILKVPLHEAENLSEAILELRKNITSCNICGGISDSDICSICTDDRRDKTLVCVLEEARDMLTIERSMEFHGIYHVLKGTISPLQGVGPEDIRIEPLVRRCEQGIIKEIIIATNPTIEGDATALFLAQELMPLGIKITRIALGMPVGSNMEFIDNATIARSLAGRTEF